MIDSEKSKIVSTTGIAFPVNRRKGLVVRIKRFFKIVKHRLQTRQ